MAKKSVIARERKRERMVAKYAELRKRLKEEGNYEMLDKLPRNASPVRLLQGKIPGITKASW